MLALALAACACFMRPVAGGGSCQSLNSALASTIAATRTPDAGFLRVPVAIHIMTNPQDPTSPPQSYWTPTVIDRYFGAGNLSVNNVWRQAQIHFSLIRVEQCTYVPPPGTYVISPASGTWGMLTPDPFTVSSRPPALQQVIIDNYLQLNVDYGCCNAVNVYLWRTIHGGANGYGESPLRNRPEVQQRHLRALPTVWYESGLACGTGNDVCQLGLAHEFGHSLGLRHTCDSCTCCAVGAGPSGTTACVCEQAVAPTLVNSCGEAMGCCGPAQATLGRLMYPVAGAFPASGYALCAGEISSARANVQAFF